MGDLARESSIAGAQAPDSDGQKKVHGAPHLREYFQDIPSFTNPLRHNQYFRPIEGFFVTEDDMVIKNIDVDIQTMETQVLYHRAGPRSEVCFNPDEVRAAIVTCGRICPGVNTVIGELVDGLWYQYGVRDIKGIKSGYRGFYSSEPVALYPKLVSDWHKTGGTMLETSKGGFDLQKIVNGIEGCGFNQVYIIGGDGTMNGAVKIFEEVKRRRLKVSIVGIPSSVDNDVGIIDRCFGFHTATEAAQSAIDAAHVEAESATNGIGLVKLMGKNAGHIALHSTLGSRDVDCCLIPENPFYLEGEGGLFEFLENRLTENGHAVLVVAEGAGQHLIPRGPEEKEMRDEYGNPIFSDVGPWLRDELKNWWKKNHSNELFTLKYVDPTYMIRAVPANAADSIYCTLLAHSAIHGAMAGYTGFAAGMINGIYAYLPLDRVTATQKFVDINEELVAELEPLDLNLNKKFVGKVIKTPAVKTKQIISFLQWAFKQPVYVPSPRELTSLISVMHNKGGVKLELLRSLIEETAENHEGVINNSVLNTLIQYLGRSGGAKEALEVFKQFDKFKCEPGSQSYYLTIRALCMSSLYDEAWSVFEEMDKNGHFPCASTIGKIIQLFCRGMRPNEAHAIYLKAIENRKFPRHLTLYALVRSLCVVAETPEVAAEILKSIKKEKNRRAKHVRHSCLVLIQSFCKKQKIEEAQAILSWMITIGMPPDNAIYNAVITGLCKGEKPDEAMTLLEEMPGRHIKPDIYAYNVIMSSYAKAGKMEKACEVFSKTENDNIKSHFISYQILIDGFCRQGSLEKAHHYFSELKKSGRWPNKDSYSKLIRACCIEGFDWRTAQTLLDEMEERGLSASEYTRSLVPATKELEEEALRAKQEALQEKKVNKGVKKGAKTGRVKA